MIPPQISLGPVKIHFYGALIAIAILVGWYLAKKRAHFYKQSLRSSTSSAGLKIPQKIFDDPVLLFPLIFSLIGARLYHVVDYWDIYGKNLISILYVFNGGLGIWGGIVGAIIGFFVVAKIRKIDFATILDLASPSMLLGQAIGRIGNYINQEGFGPPTNLPWGVYIFPDRRPNQFLNFSNFHPTFFYEAVLNFIFFVFLLYLTKKFKSPGQIFSSYLIFYSVTRFVVEFWRIDTWVASGIKVAHLVSLITFVFGSILLLILSRKQRV